MRVRKKKTLGRWFNVKRKQKKVEGLNINLEQKLGIVSMGHTVSRLLVSTGQVNYLQNKGGKMKYCGVFTLTFRNLASYI